MPLRVWEGVPENAIFLTQSTIGSLELSPCRVTTIPEGTRPEISEAMFAGTVVHAAVESMVMGGSPLQARSPAWLIKQAEALLVDEPGWDRGLVQLVGEPFDWTTKLSRLVESWTTEVKPFINQLDILEVEKPRWRHLADAAVSGRPIVLGTGGIDVLARHPDIGAFGIDWKTSSRPWSAGDGAASIQHDVYAWLAEPDFGHVEDWRYWVGDFRNYAWNVFPAKSTPKTITAALVRAEGWANFLDIPAEVRPHLCTPLQFKQRGWWAKPTYNHGHCPTCRDLGDSWDDKW